MKDISIVRNELKVKITGSDNGYILDQSVQTILLFEILQELKKLNAGIPAQPAKGETKS